MNPTTSTWGSGADLIQAFVAVVSVGLAITAFRGQQKQAERLKILESQLGKTQFEHQTQFVKLHEQRAQVIAEVYRRIMILEIWIRHVVSETQLPDEVFTSPEDFAEDFDNVFGQISINLQDLAAYFNLNRLYLEEHLCRKIVHFHDVMLEKTDPIHGFFYQRFKKMSEAEIEEMFGNNLEERAQQVLANVSDSRRAVENEFRQLLGIRIGSKDKVEEVQADNDLMWIPTPESIDPVVWKQRIEKRSA